VKPLFHIALALLMQVSTIGISVSKHYCGTMLQSVAVMEKAPGCCEAEADMPSDCCHDETTVLGSDEDFLAYSLTFHLKVPLDVAFPSDLPLPLLGESAWDAAPVAYLHYQPPLLTPDIPVRVQSFLL